MLKLISKIFGTKSEKDIKQLKPLVAKTNEEYAKLVSLSHDALRSKTIALQEKISEGLKSIDGQIADYQKQIDDNPKLSIDEKEAIYNGIDKLEEDRNKELEVILMDILPEAFAIVKDTARRFTENTELEVEATLFDKQMASTAEHVTLNGEKAIWQNSWDAAGTQVTWNMLHYDVQLIGGMVLHQGKIAEMATGEGKTLVATLPAFLNALANRGVHIVTVNDYLAKRDSEWMAPIFQFHGISVDCIDKHQPNSDARRAAYGAHITYGTNNEFGFDYLRDNMAKGTDELVQKRHHYAMVDEVDSVLVDEARTPLIISGPVPKGDEHEFHDLKPRIGKLVEEQKKLAGQFLNEAKKLIKEGNNRDAGLSMFRAHRAFPKYKPLIKFLSETGMRQMLQKTENVYLADNQKLMPEADEPLFFTIDEKQNSVDLSEKGIGYLTKDSEDPKFFILPDIGEEIAKLENAEDLDKEAQLQKKEALIQDYTVKSQRIHSMNQLLKAYTMFEKDTDYILVDGKVMIVDEQTGRVMEGRRYSDGLHQALEAKENVKVEDATQTYATITLQNYFRMYHKLAGMTGTAETEAGEFWEIYKLDVVVIPTNRPIARKDDNDLVYKTTREKFNAVVEEVVKLSNAGRPVLVGTTSVEISEILSKMLEMKKIAHQVLNAKQHAKEAEVVAEAGKPGTVTIATNMAGRGTDIKLTAESKAAGGLAIIGTERHESRRVDRQLRGRSGRQGDPGSSQFFVSLEDNLMRMFMPERMAKLMDRLGLQEGEVIQHTMITNSIERAQRKVEENNFGIRKRLLEYDDVMNSQREVIYKRRHNALFGDRLDVDILNMFYEAAEDNLLNAKDASDYESFKFNSLSVLGIDSSIGEEEFKSGKPEVLISKLYNESLDHYDLKNDNIAKKSFPILQSIKKDRGATVENVLVPFTDGKRQIGVAAHLDSCIDTENKHLITAMEKMIALGVIDQLWKEHLREMDDLKQSVQTAVHEQKDPLIVYKMEGFNLFKRFIAKVNEETISFLTKSDIPVGDPDEVQEARQQRTQSNLKEQKEESKSLLSGNGAKGQRPAEKTAPIKSQKIVGRNERVTVQYADGTIKKEVKFKTVEQDVRENKCVLID